MSEDLGEDLPVEMNTGDIIVDLKKFAMATLVSRIIVSAQLG
jgi:hypothetical protein